MKKKSLFYIILCTCLFCSCEKEEIETSPIVPPVEQPDNPDEPENKPSTEDIINIKIDENTMAIVGKVNWYKVIKDKNGYAALGGTIASNNQGWVTTSTDGENWIEPKQVLKEYGYKDLKYFAYGNGIYVVGANTEDIVLFSTDLNTWSMGHTPGQYFRPGLGIDFVNDRFVIPSGNDNESDVFTSTNGKDWKSIKIEYDGNQIAWSKVLYANNQYYAIGFHEEYANNYPIVGISKDFNNWNFIPYKNYYGGTDIYSAAYGNGKLVVCLSDRTTIVLENDSTWRKIFNIPITEVTDMTFGNNLFIITGKQNGVGRIITLSFEESDVFNVIKDDVSVNSILVMQ